MTTKRKASKPLPAPTRADIADAREDPALIDAGAADALIRQLSADLKVAADRRAVLIADARRRWPRRAVAAVLGISEWQVTDAERKASRQGQTRNERAVAATARKAADRLAEAAKGTDRA